MTTNVEIDSDLWQRFTALARQRRTVPKRLLEKLVVEYLSTEKDLQLDDAIRLQAQKSGLGEDDAVELVRRYRQKKAD